MMKRFDLMTLVRRRYCEYDNRNKSRLFHFNMKFANMNVAQTLNYSFEQELLKINKTPHPSWNSEHHVIMQRVCWY